MSAVRGSRFFRGNERVFGGATRTEADKRTFKRPVREKLALRPAGRPLCVRSTFARIPRVKRTQKREKL